MKEKQIIDKFFDEYARLPSLNELEELGVNTYLYKLKGKKAFFALFGYKCLEGCYSSKSYEVIGKGYVGTKNDIQAEFELTLGQFKTKVKNGFIREKKFRKELILGESKGKNVCEGNQTF